MTEKKGNLILSLNPGESVTLTHQGEEIRVTYEAYRPQRGVPKIRIGIQAALSVKVDRNTFNNGRYVDPDRKP
jgi:hypothetical protein